jgi:hypothetical protein
VVRLHMKKRPQARAACSLIIGSLSFYVSWDSFPWVSFFMLFE